MEKKVDPKIDFILCLLLGYLGFHKFYERKILAGCLYFITLGGFFIAWIYDCIKLGSSLLQSKNAKFEVNNDYNKNKANSINNVETASLPTDDLPDNLLIIKVAGVTYNNPDGTSRQEYIKNLEEYETLELQPYDYNGNNAIYVIDSEEHILGNIPKNMVSRIMSLIENSSIIDITIDEKGSFTNEKNEEVYYLQICINLI